MDDAPTDRQLRFIFEYLLDFNACAAAARAGYSEKSRSAQAHALMNHPAVQARLRLEIQSLLAEAGCNPLALMQERKRGAFFRARNMFKSGWEPLPLDEMEEETRQALEVSTVMRKSGPVIRVRQPDRDKALRALERVHERLDHLNQKRWDKLEREGRVNSLEKLGLEQLDPEEIAAMDEVAEFAGGEAFHAEAPTPAPISGNNYGFVRAAPQTGLNLAPVSAHFPEKTLVLSGRGDRECVSAAPPWTPRPLNSALSACPPRC